jgi:circadian clock protein KaiC
MKKKLQVIHSGIPLVDLAWGGFYRGGTYFLSGPRKSGRTILALQYAQQTINDKETCLYFSSSRPKDLLINATAVDIDLQDYINKNIFTLVRVTPAKNIEYAKDPDSYMNEYIKDLSTVVDQYKPDRVVFDELTPFIGFKDINLLTETFLETIEYIEENVITSLFIISEPITPAANKIASALMNLSNGNIFLEKGEGFLNKNNPGTIKIIPNVGHVEGEFSSKYYIEPNKGIQIEVKPKLKSSEVKISEDFTSIRDLELQQKSLLSTSFYSFDDFKLLLNNQIAYFKQTNQQSTLVSVRLSDKAEQENLLTVKQLANAIRLSIDKKDKICILRNSVLILFTKEVKDFNSLIPLIFSNLPETDPLYLKKITTYIFLNSVGMSRETIDADNMIEELHATDISDKNNIQLN